MNLKRIALDVEFVFKEIVVRNFTQKKIAPVDLPVNCLMLESSKD